MADLQLLFPGDFRKCLAEFRKIEQWIVAETVVSSWSAQQHSDRLGGKRLEDLPPPGGGNRTVEGAKPTRLRNFFCFFEGEMIVGSIRRFARVDRGFPLPCLTRTR